ncbi:MAG: aldo/keto reductase [Microbacteriaceae bacterium]
MAHMLSATRRAGSAARARISTGALELAVGRPERDPGGGLPVFGSQLRTLGWSQLRVFPVAISGETFGWSIDASSAQLLLDRYAEFGGNFIDTADSYADGLSETTIGNWLRSRGSRSSMVLATKVGTVPTARVDARAITQAVHASLRRLQTEYVDLLFLDHDDEEVPFEETLLAVDELIRAGKIRYFGASRHPGLRFIEARVIAAQVGVAPMVALQTRYNLLHRAEYENGLARLAEQQGLAVMPRTAVAAGRPRERLTRRGIQVITVIDEVAAEHGVSPATVAVAWLLNKPNVVAPVMSIAGTQQVPELMAAASLQLTRRQMAALDGASDPRAGRLAL